MKKILLISLVLCFLLLIGVSRAKSETCYKQNGLYNSSSEISSIDLRGKLMSEDDRGTSIEVTQSGSVLLVSFNVHLDDVAIFITNESGATVYNNVVSEGPNSTLIIPLYNHPSGCYTITFIHTSGTAEGSFDI